MYAPVIGPEGWTEYRAPDGQAYYYNHNTKENTWVRLHLAHFCSTDHGAIKDVQVWSQIYSCSI